MNYIFDHGLQRARARSPDPIDGADEPLRGRHVPSSSSSSGPVAPRTSAEAESVGLYGQPRTTSAASAASATSTLDLDAEYGNLQSDNPLQQLQICLQAGWQEFFIVAPAGERRLPCSKLGRGQAPSPGPS